MSETLIRILGSCSIYHHDLKREREKDIFENVI